MAGDFRSARYWAQDLLKDVLFDGARAVDATMGNGHDTQWLCERVGESGRVYAFDVQAEAVERTRQRLKEARLEGRASLHCIGHEQMSEAVHEEVDAVVFNLGWLPGAKHDVTTRVETTLQAVQAGLNLLKEEGILTVCVYPGHEEGAREWHRLLEWACALDGRRFDAMLKTYLNQCNDPPRLLAIRKKRLKKGKG